MTLRMLLFTLAGTLLVWGVVLFSKFNADIFGESFVLAMPDQEISLITAKSNQSRMLGLSGMESLPENSAMLFIFEHPDVYGIWMKDMKFSIDIIWLDEKKKIVHLEKDVSPKTYPKIFSPTHKSAYVIETNAGFAEKNGLAVGNTLNFYKR